MANRNRAGWRALIGLNLVGLCVLGLWETSTIAWADNNEPFANSVQQRAEMIEQLKEINALLKEQNALLQSGGLTVVIATPQEPPQ
jgi:hypothetical protein